MRIGNPEHDRYFSCTRKLFSFGSPILATKQAYHLEEINPGETYEIYRCRWCGLYHVGHIKDRSMYFYDYEEAPYK